ncbi:hypothetical protein Tco_1442572 [Tanacetum coccineum]
MGGSASQPRTDQVHSPINAFPLKELYTPDFLESLQENIGFWQAPNPYEVPVEQVGTSLTKKKATRNRQKKIQSDDAPRQTPWTTEEEIALCKGWLAIFENSKHGNLRKQGSFWCEEIQRPKGKDKARAVARKNKGSKSLASSSVNEDALARLMVTEMGAQEKGVCLAFLEIKRREVECSERELEQQDMKFYLQPYDHLVGDQRKAIDKIRAKIKAKYNLQY